MKDYESAVESGDQERIDAASEAVTEAEREHFRRLGVELHEPSAVVKALPYALVILLVISVFIGIQNGTRTADLAEQNTVSAFKSCDRGNEARDGRLDNLRADVDNLRADRALLTGIPGPEIDALIEAKDQAIAAKTQAIEDELNAIEPVVDDTNPEHADCFKVVPAAREIDQHLLIEQDDD